MATPHLTSDNANATGAANTDRLASVVVSGSADTHLVIVTQTADWDTKDLLVTPSEGRWVACMATGIEAYPTVQGGASVKADTDALVNAIGSRLDTLSWRSGYRPVVSAFTRGSMRGPYSHRPGVSTDSKRAEYIYSVAAYKFNLKHIHLSKLTSFKAYLRVYVPSLAVQKDASAQGLYGCTLMNSALYGNASRLCCRLEKELPTFARDLAEGYDSWEFQGCANNGQTVNGDTNYARHSVAYNPYHGDDCVSMPVWTANQRTNSASAAAPTMYYHDFQITDTDNLDFLKTNPADLWAVVHFTRGNGFTDGQTNRGLAPNISVVAWMYRADIVLSCTGAKF